MKKIVLLSASPNGPNVSNSHTLLESFKEGLGDGFQLVEQRVFDLPMGAYAFDCRVPDAEKEPELVALLDHIKTADALVFATPTYNFSVPAGLKNLVDRMSCIALDYTKKNAIGQPVGQLGHLRTYCLITGGTPPLGRLGLFFLYPGFWLRVVMAYFGCYKTKTMYAQGTFSDHIRDKKAVLDRAKTMGQNARKALLG